MAQRDFSKERKDLQEKGLAPSWFTTMGWQLFSQKYLNGDSKTPKDQYQRIAKTLAKQALLNILSGGLKISILQVRRGKRLSLVLCGTAF